jgi:hypothetical protein
MRPAWLLALVAVSLALPPSAFAGVDRAKVAAAEQAANQIVRLARDSAKTGKPPRESTPEVKALLDKAFDTSATSATGVEFSDLPRINQWMAIGDRVGLIYMLAGTGTNNLMQAATNPKTAKLIPQNIATFEAEYGRFSDFQIALWGYALDAIAAKLATAPAAERENPKFKGGLNQIGGSIAQTIAGVITTFTTEGISDDWRRARLKALNEIAPNVAKAMPAPIRAKLQEITLNVSEKMQDPQVKESVKGLAETFVK